MKCKYTPAHIANYFLACASDEKIVMTPLKLMKMIYFSYAWYLYLDGQDLFEEKIEAWKHGPVIPSIFHEFKHFGLWGNIKNTYATHIDLASQLQNKPQYPVLDEELDIDTHLNTAVCGVWFLYKNEDGAALEDISHQEGSAWKQFYKEGENVVLNGDDEQKSKIKARARQGIDRANELNK